MEVSQGEVTSSTAVDESDIPEAVVLSASTSNLILSRALSGEGKGNIESGVDASEASPNAASNSQDDINSDEHVFGYKKVSINVFIMF